MHRFFVLAAASWLCVAPASAQSASPRLNANAATMAALVKARFSPAMTEALERTLAHGAFPAELSTASGRGDAVHRVDTTDSHGVIRGGLLSVYRTDGPFMRIHGVNHAALADRHVAVPDATAPGGYAHTMTARYVELIGGDTPHAAVARTELESQLGARATVTVLESRERRLPFGVRLASTRLTRTVVDGGRTTTTTKTLARTVRIGARTLRLR